MIFKPDDISHLDPTKPVGDGPQEGMKTPSQPFESYMQRAGEKGDVKTPALSPFDLAHGQTTLAAGPTFASLLTQVKSAQTALGDVNTQLNTPNLKLKQSQRYLLRNKLTDANTHLRAANAKMGVQLPPSKQGLEGEESMDGASKGKGIIGKFLDYVSEGNANLAAAQKQLYDLQQKGDSLKPADFLTIQLKLAHAQQEIEYSSIMLSKAVDDMKTLFNIQL